MATADTIAAIATAPGRGAIGLLMVNTAADEAGQPWARTAGRGASARAFMPSF